MTNMPNDLARTIDHTLLKPESLASQIDALCEEAVEHGFAGVCVNPIWVSRVAGTLDDLQKAGSGKPRPAIVSVTGFPLGCCDTATKVDQATRAMDHGATEIDMVIQVGALIEGDQKSVRRDIEAVAAAVHRGTQNGILKVILETRALSDEQIILGCRCAAQGEADFVKTSTGFHPSGGASVEHVRLLHRYASPIRVKASGGIRTAKESLAMIEAGATRIGTSWGVAIMRELAVEFS